MRTFRVLVLLLLVSNLSGAPALAGGAHSRPTKPRLTRVVTIAYTQPCAVALVTGYPYFVTNCPDSDPGQDLNVLLKNDERHISVRMIDDSGRKVGLLFQQSFGGIYKQTRAVICGEGPQVPVDGVTYAFDPAVLIGSTDCPYPPTSGVIKVSLYT